MWVDLLHSFYTMPINIWIGGTLYPATIRWFKAPANAQRFPLPTVFFSHVDDSIGDAWPGEPGELGSPRTNDHGANPGYQGQCYIGDPMWFLTGQLPASVLNPPPQPSPCVCSIPPAIAAGGLVLGGSANYCQLVSSGAGCSLCPGGTQTTWTVTIAGGSGAFAQFNGAVKVVQANNCNWSNTCFGFSYVLRYLFPPGPWAFTMANGATVATYHVSGSFDCMAGGTFALFSSSGVGTPAPTVVVAP